MDSQKQNPPSRIRDWLIYLITFAFIIACIRIYVDIIYISRLTERYELSYTKVCEKLNQISERRAKLKNIEKTVVERYAFLSELEVHYYSIIFLEFSEKYEMPWEVLAAIVRVESNFDPSLRSNKGAKGMTQVIEQTGKQMAKEIGIKYKFNKTLWNDILNMIIGFSYFGKHYRLSIEKGYTTDESVKEAIGVYLGGPNFKRRLNSTRVYVIEYQTTVYQEYKTLRWMFQGISTSNEMIDELSCPPLLSK